MGLMAVPVVLIARAVSVGVPYMVLNNFRKKTNPNTVEIMTWGGLRGGISIALALSLPLGLEGRETIIEITYVVVVFSLLVQATSLGKVIGYLSRKSAKRAATYSIEDPVEHHINFAVQQPILMPIDGHGAPITAWIGRVESASDGQPGAGMGDLSAGVADQSTKGK